MSILVFYIHSLLHVTQALKVQTRSAWVEFTHHFGLINTAYLVGLSLCLLTAYMCLLLTLRNFESEMLKAISQRMKYLFLVFFGSYLLQTIYFTFDGSYDKAIKSYFVRTIITLITPIFFELVPISVILYLHAQNNPTVEEQEHPSVVIKSYDSHPLVALESYNQKDHRHSVRSVHSQLALKYTVTSDDHTLAETSYDKHLLAVENS